MEIVSKAKYLRTSPRKLRLVADLVRNQTPKEALVILENLEKRAAKPILKALKQAIANAKENFNLGEEGLKLKKIEIGEGPIYKRWQPVSRGLAHPIKKRTAHITVVLESEQKKEEKGRI